MNGCRPGFYPQAAFGIIEKNAARFCNENRSRLFRIFFVIAIMIAISNEKSRIDFAGKITERFLQKKRDPLVKS